MDTFLEWCEQQGIHRTKVDIKPTDYSGCGLFLNTTCNDSAPLVHIPSHLLITSTRLLTNSNTPKALIECLETTLQPESISLEDRIKLPGNEKICLRLFLAYEIHQSRSLTQPPSFWQTYIKNLPSLAFFKRNHVLFLDMDDEENLLFGLLEGTSMASSIRAKHASLYREWQRMHDLVSWDMTLEDWIYADVLLWSRVVGLNGEGRDEGLAMIPFFDFANHRMDPNLRWQLAPGGLDLVPFNTPISAGEELCLTYGAKSNQELLFLHGFTMADNPTDGQVTLSLGPFLNPGMDQESTLKWQWLQQQDDPPFKPILVLGQPTSDAVFGHTGWTFHSICMMYLAVLDQDDGLELKVVDGTDDDDDDDDNTESARKGLEQLDISANTEPRVELSLNGKHIQSWKDLSSGVMDLAHAPVVQLRVTMMLLDASQYHLQQILFNTERLEEDQGVSESPLYPHIMRYRDEERQLLKQSVDVLSMISEILMENDTVKEYLDKANAEDDDE